MAVKSRSFGKRGKNDLRDFSVRATKLGDNIQKAVNLVVQDTAIAVAAHLARSTPIDMGRARSNWVVQLGFPVFLSRLPFSAYPSRWRPPYGPGGSFGEARNTAGVTWSATKAVKGRAPGQPIYISNNVAYIAYLNRGHSGQAPAGFVDAAILTATAQIRETAQQRFDGI